MPAGGEARIRIIKTYQDPKSYFTDGDAIVFDRPLGIKRNAVVLPPDYELIVVQHPAQILEEPDGRVGISFVNTSRRRRWCCGRAPPRLHAAGPSSWPSRRRRRRLRRSPLRSRAGTQPMNRVASASARSRIARSSTSSRTRTRTPSACTTTTPRRAKAPTIPNVVRRGSTVSNPSAKNLDTGEALKVETLKGDAIAKAGIDIGEPVCPDSEVVVIRFPKVKKGSRFGCGSRRPTPIRRATP